MARHFVALLPPPPLAEAIDQLKRHFAETYGSQAALRSPAHVTLQPPFEWPEPEKSRLETTLATFAAGRPDCDIELTGFGAFAPRVIYVDVVPTAALAELQAALAATLAHDLGVVDAQARRRFVPHLTVAFRDLTPAAFRAAWPQFQERPFSARFTAHGIALLTHDGRRWQVECEYPFAP